MKRSSSKTTSAKPLRGKKTWREKLADDKDLPKVVKLEGDDALRYGGTTLAIPAPREVDALIRKVPRGKLATTDELRAAVARQHGAEAGCPITTGIFSWIAAQAADEAAGEGLADITPYWRILKTKGELNPKYPGGIAALTARLEAEGHTIVQRGKRFFVRDYEQVIAKLG
jgi:alkylated DNA nucleotide flippase Atl1